MTAKGVKRYLTSLPSFKREFHRVANWIAYALSDEVRLDGISPFR